MRGERRRSGLTAREREVLDLVRVGLTNDEIAGRLGISPDTAKFHVSQILARLGVATREEAAALVVPDKHRGWRRLGAWGLAAKLALTTATLVVLAGLGGLAWAVALRGGDAREAITPGQLVYGLGDNQITIVDPQNQEVVHTIPTGYDPEITIAPDGSTIYLTDRDLTDRSSASNYSLSVIDARDWHVITKLPSPDRIANIPVGSYGMAVSADGRYVYIHKWKILGGRYEGPNGYSAPKTDHWWDIFDTKTQKFADNPPHVPDCGEAKAFPPMNTSSALAILCYEINALVFIDPQSGQVTRSISTYDTPGADLCLVGDSAGAGRTVPPRPLDFADGAQAPDGTIYLVTTGGCIRTIDPVEMTVRKVFPEALPDGWRVPYDLVALSPSGDHLFIGVGPGMSSANYGNEVWVLDTETQSRISTIQIEQTASSLTTSPDGRVLYTVSWESNDMASLDAGSGQRLWLMTNLAAPSVVRSAPRPLGLPQAHGL